MLLLSQHVQESRGRGGDVASQTFLSLRTTGGSLCMQSLPRHSHEHLSHGQATSRSKCEKCRQSGTGPTISRHTHTHTHPPEGFPHRKWRFRFRLQIPTDIPSQDSVGLWEVRLVSVLTTGAWNATWLVFHHFVVSQMKRMKYVSKVSCNVACWSVLNFVVSSNS